MFRLALTLTLFLGLTVASVATADPAPASTAAPVEAQAVKPAETTPAERIERIERESRPRWVPSQARRQRELGPALTPYPALLRPSGIPTLPF